MFSILLTWDVKRNIVEFGKDSGACVPTRFANKIGPNVSLIFHNDELMSIRGIQCPLPDVTAMVALATHNYKKGAVIHLHTDPLLAFISNISVGEFGLFFVENLSIGLSIGFRIEYEVGRVRFGQVSRFESEGPPVNVASDWAAVALTFSRRLSR
jgi:hypothetical protein